MIFALIGILFFLVLLLIAVKFGLSRNKRDQIVEEPPVIHTSGIYSIVRKSPRENIAEVKPSEKKIHQYLKDQNVDMEGNTISDAEKQQLLQSWSQVLERSIKEVEEGDKKGVEFYYYDFSGNDAVCHSFVNKGDYVTRQDIYKHPELIPPFHVGCKCTLLCHLATEKIRDTKQFQMKYLLQKGKVPNLPDWKLILR